MGTEILRCAQDDTGWPIRFSSPHEQMLQSVGINGSLLHMYMVSYLGRYRYCVPG